jgi:hypothetical protein
MRPPAIFSRMRAALPRSVLGIATRAEEQADLATLRSQIDADLASVILPIGKQLNAIQASLSTTNQAIILAAIAALATQVSALQGSITTMSATLQSDLDAIKADFVTIAAGIASLQASLAAAGVSPAVQAEADALKASADAMVSSMAPPPPVVTPVP